MHTFNNSVPLEYNTERERLTMPEYGRNILKMVEMLQEIPDREQRSRQARAVVKAMELLNPQVHQEENWEQKLWDHLHIISGYNLDVDCPYPVPSPEQQQTKPLRIPLKDKPVKATHYGRNIESIIELIASQPESEQKTAMIRSLAIYMRQQYLIWNKDSVADETIFHDIEKLSDHEITIPEGLSLDKISNSISYAKPGLGINVGQPSGKNHKKNNKQRNKKKQ